MSKYVIPLGYVRARICEMTCMYDRKLVPNLRDLTDISKAGGVTWSRRQGGPLDLCRGDM